jgi:hypothetical protein
LLDANRLHLLDSCYRWPQYQQRRRHAGWVNTVSGFFSREFDPTFTFNAGTSNAAAPDNCNEYIGDSSLFVPLNRHGGSSGNCNEYIGASSLFVPLNRRFQIGLFVPFVDGLQATHRQPVLVM